MGRNKSEILSFILFPKKKKQLHHRGTNEENLG